MSMKNDPLAPYDAVLLCSYGGPDGPNAVLPFMKNATNGRNIPDARLAEVSTHYERFDGVSPIIARTHELIAALDEELAARGSRARVYLGNRNWHPYFIDTLRRMIHAGHRRILMVPTAAFASYSGCRQYREDVWAAQQALIDEGVVGADELTFERPALMYVMPGFRDANRDAIIDAWNELTAAGFTRPLVQFVTHSIPTAMQDTSGVPGHDFIAQHHEFIADLMSHLPDDIHSPSRPLDYELVYCSRSGSPRIPWLEPDINDAITSAAARGVRAVIAAPIGFIQDHMEVVHDLDIEAGETAAEVGIGFARAATASIHPAFVSGLVDQMATRAEAARSGAPACTTGVGWHDDPQCCHQYADPPFIPAIHDSQETR